MSTLPSSSGESAVKGLDRWWITSILAAVALGVDLAAMTWGADAGAGWWWMALGLLVAVPLAFVVATRLVILALVLVVRTCGAVYDLLTVAFEGAESRPMVVEILGEDDPDVPRPRRRSRGWAMAVLAVILCVWVVGWMAVWLRWRDHPDARMALVVGLGFPASFVLIWAIDRHEWRRRGGSRPL
jgi:hypothetical protein